MDDFFSLLSDENLKVVDEVGGGMLSISIPQMLLRQAL